MTKHVLPGVASAAATLSLLVACGGTDAPQTVPPPQLTPATGAALPSCSNLATAFSFANTTITAANPIAAGTLTVAGTPIPAHCQVTGTMFSRTSPVDGQSYAVGFEMRLPNAWNDRFFYPANVEVAASFTCQ